MNMAHCESKLVNASRGKRNAKDGSKGEQREPGAGELRCFDVVAICSDLSQNDQDFRILQLLPMLFRKHLKDLSTLGPFSIYFVRDDWQSIGRGPRFECSKVMAIIFKALFYLSASS